MRLADWPRDPYLNEEVREWVQLHLETLGVTDVAVFAAVVGRDEDERRVVVATEVGLLDSWYAPRGSSARFGLSVRLYPWQAVHGVDLRGETSRVWAYEHESRWRLRVARPALDLLAETPELGRALAQFAAACAVMAEPAGSDDVGHPVDTSTARAFAAPPEHSVLPVPPPRADVPVPERPRETLDWNAPIPTAPEPQPVEATAPQDQAAPMPTPSEPVSPVPGLPEPPSEPVPQPMLTPTPAEPVPQPMAGSPEAASPWQAAPAPEIPTQLPTEPVIQPAVESAQPAVESAQPAVESAQPAVELAQPAADAADDLPVSQQVSAPQEIAPEEIAPEEIAPDQPLVAAEPVQEPRAVAWQQLADEPAATLPRPELPDGMQPESGQSLSAQPAIVETGSEPRAEEAGPEPERPSEPPPPEPRPSPFQRPRRDEPAAPVLPEPAMSFEEQYPGEEVLFDINPLPAEPPPTRFAPRQRTPGQIGGTSPGGNGSHRPAGAAQDDSEGRQGPFPRQVVDSAAPPPAPPSASPPPASSLSAPGEARSARFPGQIFRVGANSPQNAAPERASIKVEAESTAEIILDLERRLGLRPRR